MIDIYSLLEYAIGDIRKDVMAPPQSTEEVLAYYRAFPSLMSLLDVFDVMIDTYDISRIRYVYVPFGHSFDTVLDHIKVCGNSAYRSTVYPEHISINDWYRYASHEISIKNGLYEIRKSLLVHILKDGEYEQLDTYIREYIEVILSSLLVIAIGKAL